METEIKFCHRCGAEITHLTSGYVCPKCGWGEGCSNDIIEIPFGAHDSELKGWEYTIPEGMEAEIKDGKIIVREKESEDERMRKLLIKWCQEHEREEWFEYEAATYGDVLAWLEKKKEQKPIEWNEVDYDGEIADLCDGSMSLTSKDIARHFYELGQRCYKPAGWSEEDEYNLAWIVEMLYGLEDNDKDFEKECRRKSIWLRTFPERFNLPLKQEWSEEDEKMWVHDDDIFLDAAKMIVEDSPRKSYGGVHKKSIVPWFYSLKERLKTLRPQPKQESEPIEIKYAGKIYKVYGTKELPGGVVGYIIEDEPGHYDCIIHPDEVLGGGYGIKSNGSPYPTKEANFGQPHWKPSEEQMRVLRVIILKNRGYVYETTILCTLYDDLMKLK